MEISNAITKFWRLNNLERFYIRNTRRNYRSLRVWGHETFRKQHKKALPWWCIRRNYANTSIELLCQIHSQRVYTEVNACLQLQWTVNVFLSSGSSIICCSKPFRKNFHNLFCRKLMNALLSKVPFFIFRTDSQMSKFSHTALCV